MTRIWPTRAKKGVAARVVQFTLAFMNRHLTLGIIVVATFAPPKDTSGHWV